MNMASMVCAAD